MLTLTSDMFSDLTSTIITNLGVLIPVGLTVMGIMIQQPLQTKKFKILFVILIALLFYIILGNINNSYGYYSVTNYYYFSDYSDISNLELTLHSGTTYYFDNLPLDPDSYYYFIFGDDDYLSFLYYANSMDNITNPALVLFLNSNNDDDDYFYLRLIDEATGTLYNTVTYYISYDKLSTDYLEPTDISSNYDGRSSGQPISVGSSTLFSTFRIYYLTYNIYYTTLDYADYYKSSTTVD